MIRRLLATLPCVLLFVLTGCSIGAETTAGLDTADTRVVPTWTPAPSPSATAIPPGSAATPTNVPTGWNVYAAPHFSIAYPGDWIVQIAPLQGGGATYEFLNTVSIGSVQVAETNDVDSATAASICSSTDTKVTFAGLPMRYSTGNYGRTLI